MVSEKDIENHVWDKAQAQKATAKEVKKYIQQKLDDYVEINISGTELYGEWKATSRSQPSARTVNQQRTSATSFGKTEYIFEKVARPSRKSSRTPFTTLKNGLNRTRNVRHGYS
jgi:hypothetical protein